MYSSSRLYQAIVSYTRPYKILFFRADLLKSGNLNQKLKPQKLGNREIATPNLKVKSQNFFIYFPLENYQEQVMAIKVMEIEFTEQINPIRQLEQYD